MSTLSLCSINTVADPLDILRDSESSALQVTADNGESLISLRADTPLIPASTLKILTALIAIEQWGLEHHFHTDFYIGEDNQLVIKGFGDPFLISEEIDLIADALQQSGKHQFSSIILDSSHFSKDIRIDGQSSSNNPYDAPPGAIAANFNTVYLLKQDGKISSMESQTPLTPVAKEIGLSIQTGKHRVNIEDTRTGAIYFAEVLRAKLKLRGIRVTPTIEFHTVPENAKLLYRHYNSHSLEDLIQAMLKFSTNFISNQLFLILGAETGLPPASIERSRHYYQAYIQQEFNWKNTVIMEGAGLSRSNKISANQLILLLERFHSYANLLPVHSTGVIGKTGTLKGVSCFAGYLSREKSAPAFALLINDASKSNLRKPILRQLFETY